MVALLASCGASRVNLSQEMTQKPYLSAMVRILSSLDTCDGGVWFPWRLDARRPCGTFREVVSVGLAHTVSVEALQSIQ